MRIRWRILACLCLGGLLVWFLADAGAVRDSVAEALALCARSVVPSLFPFLVASSALLALGFGELAAPWLAGLMEPLFRVPGAGSAALVLGLVGGYPIGAKTAADLYRENLVSREEAERLLAFCNNSGPAFILGVVGAGVFASSRVGVLLYLAHAAASICIGILFRFYKAGPTARREERQSRPQFHAQRFTTAFTGSIKNSFLSTLNICAFVVFFTVVIQLLIRSGFLPGLAQVLGTVLAPFGLTPEWAQRLLTGALEISSGVWTLSGDGTLSGKLILAAFMLGWAGISVHCQVLSFIGGSGLSVGTYLVGKLLHGGLAALFIAVLVRLFPLEAPVSDYLADQVAGIAGMDFHRTLVISLVCAWVLFLFFLFVAAAAARKSLGKRHRSVL